jgi:hypothetical protein
MGITQIQIQNLLSKITSFNNLYAAEKILGIYA